jgi:hypothetical protein
LGGLTTALSIAQGGTGANTATAAFNALNPMTTTGDMLYEASPTTAARLAIGSTGQVLTVAGGIPSWATPASGSDVVIVSSSSLFTSSGTYTVPTLAANEQLYALMIGGGGSGCAGKIAGNGFWVGFGGQGRVGMALLHKPSLASTVTYTIGAGGAALSTSADDSVLSGNKGGNTEVFSSGYCLTSLAGGDGGFYENRGGNFTALSSMFSRIQSDTNNGQNSLVFNPAYEYGVSGRGGATDTTVTTVPLFLGGGTTAISGTTQRTQNIQGAPSRTFTGAGGNGNMSGAASAGTAPGGGGGSGLRYNATSTSGAGASGGIRFFVVQGIYDPASVFNKVFTL